MNRTRTVTFRKRWRDSLAGGWAGSMDGPAVCSILHEERLEVVNVEGIYIMSMQK